MELTLSNPAGLWALLAIPLVIAFHFLQRRRQRFLTSTLFLVPERQLQEKKGTRFQFWRNSFSFWLQILVVLLVTWLLTAPRWIASNWYQHVVLIHDASISMRAFEQERLSAVDEIVDSITKLTRRTEWVLLPTDARAGVEFRGMDADAFISASRDYLPSAGQHSFEQAYQLANELNRDGKARIILLTDHVPETMPPGVECYSIGRPVENVGFAGLSVNEAEEEGRWRATVRNYGSEPVSILWQMKRADVLLHEAMLRLKPRSTEVITSTFPEEGEGPVELQIQEDAFASDNRILLYPPQPKRLRYLLSGTEEFAQRMDESLRVLPILEGISPESEAHVICMEFNSVADLQAPVLVPYRIQFSAAVADGQARQGFYTTERHALMLGLNWNALRYLPATDVYMPGTGDTVLLWHNAQPLILLRGDRELVFNFSPLEANALQLPAFVILINRFLEQSAAELPLPTVRNFEGNQSLGFEHLDMASEDVLEYWVDGMESPQRIQPGQIVRAPVDPKPLKADLNGTTILEGAVFFAETSEADFSNAAEMSQLEAGTRDLIENNSEEDFLTSLWLILLGVVLILSWHTSAKGM